MRFAIDKESLLGPLQMACGVVERRQTSPVLSNLLLVLGDNQLTLTGSDQEVELKVLVTDAQVDKPGETTVSARKLVDICRSLPEGSNVTVKLDGKRVAIDSGNFSSHLATLPAADFPAINPIVGDVSFELAAATISRLLQRTSFAMAQQDVRYFFNGILLEVREDKIRFVATNGQRLATSQVNIGNKLGNHQFIIPHKAISELGRVLVSEGGAMVNLDFTASHMRFAQAGVTLVTKLIDATYPDYSGAIPKGGDKIVVTDRQLLKEALFRTAILSNELYRNIRLNVLPGKLNIHANNPQQEEAEESVSTEYEGEPLTIGFNVNYLIDALSAMEGDKVRLTFTSADKACLLENPDDTESLFVVSPMVIQ